MNRRHKQAFLAFVVFFVVAYLCSPVEGQHYRSRARAPIFGKYGGPWSGGPLSNPLSDAMSSLGAEIAVGHLMG
ncbi:unnamed protein product [Soboliphyme baturini]|uniref:Secreted protein n=1 Tax=Soboliphyme baturini TaxID=241478 RepID=A0A183IGM3_9BILA|nr:unnamed protein product [Soboliphyme baturini]